MKKRIRDKKLEALLESINQKSPNGLLAIQCEFESFLQKLEFKYLLTDVCVGKVGRKAVIKRTLQSIKMVIRRAEKDALNIRRCTAFITRKYPHAIFSGENFTIEVDNLTPPEIEDCLLQKDLRFTYFSLTNP